MTNLSPLQTDAVEKIKAWVAAPRKQVFRLFGYAGTGKTTTIATAVEQLGLRTAYIAYTGKAASVMRNNGLRAETLHRLIYLFEAEDKVNKELYFTLNPESYAKTVGLIVLDECSMVGESVARDLLSFGTPVLAIGDPAQLPPVKGEGGGMVFDSLPAPARLELSRVHRQDADNPILDLAHALADPALDFEDFERMIQQAARRDDRVVWAERANSDLMARSPALVWRNATRIRLIHAFRLAHDGPEDSLLPGEPLICDGLELPLKHRKKRIDLEARGLIKGAQVVYLGPGRKPGFSRLHVVGAEEPQVSAASIVKIEREGEEEPFIPFAATMGAAFLHGAAVTIHKAQGSQWPEVQVFAPDLFAAARAGRSEAGLPLWKRLAYVAITRAEHRLHWVVRNRLARPTKALGVEDLAAPAAPLTLEAEE